MVNTKKWPSMIPWVWIFLPSYHEESPSQFHSFFTPLRDRTICCRQYSRKPSNLTPAQVWINGTGSAAPVNWWWMACPFSMEYDDANQERYKLCKYYIYNKHIYKQFSTLAYLLSAFLVNIQKANGHEGAMLKNDGDSLQQYRPGRPISWYMDI